MAIGALILIVVVFAAIRIVTDWPHILAGTSPVDDDFAVRYVEHPRVSHLHIGLGLVYLLGAPLQLGHRVRTKHYTLHRRLGRILVSAGLLTGVFALVFGLQHPYGGAGQAAATGVFGTWFVACLTLAFRAIRRGDVVSHRRWMIRAFAVGVGVGTIRIWVGIFLGTGALAERTSFAVAFSIAFTLHVLAGELWIRHTPHPGG